MLTRSMITRIVTATATAGIMLAMASACSKTDATAESPAPPRGAQATAVADHPDTTGKPVSVMPNFTLGDQNGKAHELYKITDAKAVVIFLEGVGCPIVQQMTPDLKDLQAKYEPKGVKWLMLNANNQDTVPMIAAEAKSFDIKMPILKDVGQKVAEPLGVVRTAEAIVIEPTTWKILYHGPINDRLTYGRARAKADNDFVADVLDKVLAGQTVTPVHALTDGCIIDFPARAKG